MNVHTPPERSLGDIVASLFQQMASLVRNESQLARAEISEKLDKLIGAVIIVGLGAIMLLPAFVILLESAVAALIQGGVRPAAAALIVGGATLLIGIVLFIVGLGRLKAVNLVPDKTLRQLQQDVAIAKETRPHHDVQRAA
jgi:uncharacterized membrane protein YqjE